MFTPPPSPQPPTTNSLEAEQSYFPDEKTPAPESAPSPVTTHIKRRTALSAKWTVILIPLILALVTLSLRCITHRSGSMFMDYLIRHEQSPPFSLSLPSDVELPLLPELTLERRQTTGTPTTPTSTSSPVAGTAQPVPTIPDNPTIPTPFPQPFDKTLNFNGSSPSCLAFFTNMTTSTPFRACRPFSMLVQSSTDLLSAQNNLTVLNSVIYGTCHTTIPAEQCSANMAWFANNLKTACSTELSARHALVTDTITGLQSYDLMRETGCLADPTTNTYCYVNAVHNSNPSDIYFYQIPLGLVVPKTSQPTCSPCTKNIMALYADAIENESSTHQALVGTYPSARSIAVAGCGDTYARTVLSNAAISSLKLRTPWLMYDLLPPIVLSLIVFYAMTRMSTSYNLPYQHFDSANLAPAFIFLPR